VTFDLIENEEVCLRRHRANTGRLEEGSSSRQRNLEVALCGPSVRTHPEPSGCQATFSFGVRRDFKHPPPDTSLSTGQLNFVCRRPFELSYFRQEVDRVRIAKLEDPTLATTSQWRSGLLSREPEGAPVRPRDWTFRPSPFRRSTLASLLRHECIS
jgi:hypothetical protein